MINLLYSPSLTAGTGNSFIIWVWFLGGGIIWVGRVGGKGEVCINIYVHITDFVPSPLHEYIGTNEN